MGDLGCLSLYGRRPEMHRLFSEHLTAEYKVRTEGRGRVVDEWKIKPTQPNNHWFDGIVGCAVAASIEGGILPGRNRGRKGSGSGSSSQNCGRRGADRQ